MDPEPDPHDLTPGMHIWGWMSPPELRWLISLAEQAESFVEVGCLHGRSAYAILGACPGPVYCIDPWDDPGGNGYRSFMGSCGHFENLRAIRGWSPAAAAEVPGIVDAVFLDGAHSYEAVLADIAAWLPKTRNVICGHDFWRGDDAGFPGVAQAVDAVFGPERVTVAEDTSIWWVNLEMSGREVRPGLPSELTFTDEYGRAETVRFDW